MKKGKKVAAKVRVRRPKKSSGGGRRSITPYQALLADPCTAATFSPYGGERGIVERFVADVSLGAATHTAGFIFLQPAFNTYGGFSATTSAVSVAATSAPAVAAGFFNSNVQKARCVSACVELIPASLSITNITGELAMGVFDCSTFGGGLSTTVDGVFTICNNREVIQKRDYEIKWYPGSADHLYNTKISGGNLTAAEPSSQNEVVIAWRGIPANTQLSFRITIVYEWTPVSGLGLAVTSAPGREMDWKNQSADLHLMDPSWWTKSLMGGGVMGEVGRIRESLTHAAKSTPFTNALYSGLTSPQLMSNMVSHFGKLLG